MRVILERMILLTHQNATFFLQEPALLEAHTPGRIYDPAKRDAMGRRSRSSADEEYVVVAGAAAAPLIVRRTTSAW